MKTSNRIILSFIALSGLGALNVRLATAQKHGTDQWSAWQFAGGSSNEIEYRWRYNSQAQVPQGGRYYKLIQLRNDTSKAAPIDFDAYVSGGTRPVSGGTGTLAVAAHDVSGEMYVGDGDTIVRVDAKFRQ